MNVNRSHPAGEGGEGHEQMEVGGLMKRDALGNGEPPTLSENEVWGREKWQDIQESMDSAE